MKKLFARFRKKKEEERAGDLAVMREQTMRIQELKRENSDLLSKLEEFRKKEESITNAINFAQKEAERLIKESRDRYALECERLKSFRAKWVGYVGVVQKNGKLAEEFEESNRMLKECQIELEEMIYKDLMGKNPIDEVKQDYYEERARIDAEPALNYRHILKEKEEKDAPITIDLKQAANEKMSKTELEQLIKQIESINV
ncbi:MAG: hypothetical protein ACOYIQ_06580 [Christensenellales bacterium]|jgi:cell division septum initiation protein DivIVA